MTHGFVTYALFALALSLYLTGCTPSSTPVTGSAEFVTLPESKECSKDRGSVEFVHMSDVHIGDENEPEPRLRKAISLVNEIQPDFISVTGDLADNPLKATTLVSAAANLQTYLDIIADSTVPVYSTPGNHDLGYSNYPYPPRADMESLFESMVGPLNQEWQVGGFQFISIDDNAVLGTDPTRVTQAQLDWIASILDRGLPTIIFGHFPLFQWDSATGVGGTEVWGANAQALLDLIDSRSNALGFLSGHIHLRTLVVRHGKIYATAAAYGSVVRQAQHEFLLYKLNESGSLEICAVDSESGNSEQLLKRGNL